LTCVRWIMWWNHCTKWSPFIFCAFVFRKVISGKPLSKLSHVCLPLGKLINGKHFSVKWKFSLVSRKVFFFLGKHFQETVKKIINVILFVDYIKFDPQTFNWYIYILFWIFFFQFHHLKFNFYINFDPRFYNCYLFFPYHFLIEIFYLSNLALILLIVTYFIWNNL